MSYKVNVWIPILPDEPYLFQTEREAQNEVAQLKFMQPENRYEIEEVEND